MSSALNSADFADYLGRLSHAIEFGPIYRPTGRVQKVVRPLIWASLPDPHIGELWELKKAGTSGDNVFAEVIGLDYNLAILSAVGDVAGVSTSTEVVRSTRGLEIPVGPELRGRVLDALGRPADGLPLEASATKKLYATPLAPIQRRLIDRAITTGIPAIDGFLTCGEGQRLAIVGSAGTGKSNVLATIAKNSDADIVVVGLIGERGREVTEFVSRQLGPEGMARSIVVCATAERPPMERIKAAHVASAIAESFRDQGLRVLLLLDSVTRFARALREIGLAAGEPPARRGFPPSVFAAMPDLFERAGCSEKGSITAFYTVLIEDDDTPDPIGEEIRSLLDGHIVLSRKLAEAGHFPAIDVLASTSRLNRQIATSEHIDATLHLRRLIDCFQQNELLIRVGEYQPGSDSLLDEAVSKIDAINAFLQAGENKKLSFAETVRTIIDLGSPGHAGPSFNPTADSAAPA